MQEALAVLKLFLQYIVIYLNRLRILLRIDGLSQCLTKLFLSPCFPLLPSLRATKRTGRSAH